MDARVLLADVALVFVGAGDSWSVGSGRVIGPGLVLTAGHVVDFPNRAAAGRGGYQVRLVGDRRPNHEWVGDPLTAICAWRGAGDLDLALLEIGAAIPAPQVEIVFASYRDVEPLEWALVAGFPEARHERQAAIDYNFQCGITNAEGPDRSLTLMIPTAARPDRVRGWEGMSGAVVLACDAHDRFHLFGAVEEVPAGFSGQLRVARIASAFEDPDFQALLAKAIGRAPEVVAWHNPIRSTYMDRGPSEVSAVPAAKGVLAQAQTQFDAMPLEIVPAASPVASGSWVPHSPNPLFVGRSAALRTIATRLKGTGATSFPAVVALTGMGGVGKTQLAVEFALRYGPWFSGGVFWLDCVDPSTIDSQVASLGIQGAEGLPADFADLPAAKQYDAVWALLQSPVPRLLILDNCESEEVFAKLRPPRGGCRILVTSRRPSWSPNLGIQEIEVGVLSREQGIDLLVAFRPDLESDRATLGALTDELGGLPLALHLAGGYLQQRAHADAASPGAYLQALRELTFKHRSLDVSVSSAARDRSPTGHLQSVGRSLELLWDQLVVSDAVDDLARMTLLCASCYAPNVAIAPEMLATAVARLIGSTPVELDAALTRAYGLGLLQAGQEGPRIHPLIANFAFSQAADRDSLLVACGSAVCALLQEATFKHVLRSGHAAVPHAEHLLSNLREDEAPKWAFDMALFLATFSRQVGDRDAARQLLERAERLKRDRDGQHASDEAELFAARGMLARDDDDWEEAERWFARSVDMLNNRKGAVQSLATSLRLLASAQFEQNKIFDAEHNLNRALEILTADANADPTELAFIHSELGMAASHYDLSRAFTHLTEALRLNELIWGPESIQVAIDLSNLASVLRRGNRQGRVAARQHLERAIAIAYELGGPDHPYVPQFTSYLRGLPRADGGGSFLGRLFGR